MLRSFRFHDVPVSIQRVTWIFGTCTFSPVKTPAICHDHRNPDVKLVGKQNSVPIGVISSNDTNNSFKRTVAMLDTDIRVVLPRWNDCQCF